MILQLILIPFKVLRSISDYILNYKRMPRIYFSLLIISAIFFLLGLYFYYTRNPFPHAKDDSIVFMDKLVELVVIKNFSWLDLGIPALTAIVQSFGIMFLMITFSIFPTTFIGVIFMLIFLSKKDLFPKMEEVNKPDEELYLIMETNKEECAPIVVDTPEELKKAESIDIFKTQTKQEMKSIKIKDIPIIVSEPQTVDEFINRLHDTKKKEVYRKIKEEISELIYATKNTIKEMINSKVELKVIHDIYITQARRRLQKYNMELALENNVFIKLMTEYIEMLIIRII